MLSKTSRLRAIARFAARLLDHIWIFTRGRTSISAAIHGCSGATRAIARELAQADAVALQNEILTTPRLADDLAGAGARAGDHDVVAPVHAQEARGDAVFGLDCQALRTFARCVARRRAHAPATGLAIRGLARPRRRKPAAALTFASHRARRLVAESILGAAARRATACRVASRASRIAGIRRAIVRLARARCLEPRNACDKLTTERHQAPCQDQSNNERSFPYPHSCTHGARLSRAMPIRAIS
jgi:hypothetical protein